MQESKYTLRGAISEGAWTVALRDFYPDTVDYRVHAQLVHRAAGGAEQLIVETDVHVIGTSTAVPFGLSMANGPAVAAACGDQLLLRLEVTSGIMQGEGTAAIARVIMP